MREEVQLRLLRNPMWTAHRRDQLGGIIRELRCVGDTVALLLSVPAASRQSVLAGGSRCLPFVA
jgi:hypothetical protein